VISELNGFNSLGSWVEIKGEIVAAIVVGGAADGDKDEACAMKGLEKIKDRMPH
jgi:uncharacterized protein GlcG (DUF336 family)